MAWQKYVKIVCWMAGGAAVVVIGTPAVLAAAGFGAEGIVAGSWAVTILDVAGKYGMGEVVVQGLEALGKSGFSTLEYGALAIAGAALGMVGSFLLSASTGVGILLNTIDWVYGSVLPTVVRRGIQVASFIASQASTLASAASKLWNWFFSE